MRSGYKNKVHYLKDTIFRVLAAHPYGLSSKELIEKVYRGMEPDFPRSTLQVTIHRIRKMSLPWTVLTIYRCGWRYILVFK